MADTAVGCSNPPAQPKASSDALELEVWLKGADRGGRSGGIVARRYIAGTTTWSVHACGRAVDWFPSSPGAGNWLMDRLVHDRPHRIQRVIWRHVQVALRDGVWIFEPYSKDDHGDHLHVEVLP